MQEQKKKPQVVEAPGSKSDRSGANLLRLLSQQGEVGAVSPPLEERVQAVEEVQEVQGVQGGVPVVLGVQGSTSASVLDFFAKASTQSQSPLMMQQVFLVAFYLISLCFSLISLCFFLTFFLTFFLSYHSVQGSAFTSVPPMAPTPSQGPSLNSTPGLQGHNGHSHGPSPHQGPLHGLLQGPGHGHHQGPPHGPPHGPPQGLPQGLPQGPLQGLPQGPPLGLPQGLQALPISQGLSLGMVPVTVPMAPSNQVGSTVQELPLLPLHFAEFIKVKEGRI